METEFICNRMLILSNYSEFQSLEIYIVFVLPGQDETYNSCDVSLNSYAFNT